MPYKVHCHVRDNQFYEIALEKPEDVIDFVFENCGIYNPLRVFKPQDSGLYNCVLMVSDGQPRWGEYSLLQAAKIRDQELEYWPDIATNAEYQRVTLDQVDDYYTKNEDDVMMSIWPERPEMSEVVMTLAYENNPNLFNMNGPAATDGVEAMAAPTMQM